MIATLSLAAVLASSSHDDGLRLGGRPLALVAARGSLWALTCDTGCTGEARRSVGRIIRLDPRTGREVGSVAVDHPTAVAIASSGVYATDFWRDTVRRYDPASLRLLSTLTVALPFRFTRRDNAFLPIAVAVGSDAVWVGTERCVLARADLRASRVHATVRLPCDAFGGLAVAGDTVWVGESLLGVYRIDPATNRVTAKIPIGSSTGRFSVDELVAGGGKVFAVGTWTDAGVTTTRRGVARIDVRSNTLEGVSQLPSGPLAVAFGGGSLWVARIGGSDVERIDPATGKLVARLHARAGTVIAFAGGALWIADANGALRRVGVR